MAGLRQTASTRTPTPQAVVDRLLERIEITPGGCWISLYSTGSHGYSQIGWQTPGKLNMRLGHRVSWEALHGPIPYGQTIEHLCKVRRCINPEHLTILPNLENARGGGGHHVGIPVPTGKVCGKGLHPLLQYPSGAVGCRECQIVRARNKRARAATNINPTKIGTP